MKAALQGMTTQLNELKDALNDNHAQNETKNSAYQDEQKK